MRRSVSGLHAGATPLDGVYGPDPSSTLVGGTMDNPRPDKVAVVNEVRDRLEAADGAVLTEYRGLTVAELAALRSELAQAGGDYKVYKNTLVRLAVADGPQAELRDLLTGPTAIAFVQGDVSAVAKALRDFSRTNPNLVVKGGVVGSGLLSASDINVLADLPSRDTLLAQFAGALAAPLQQLAGLMQALPRNLAYGISALVDQRQAGGETLETPAEAEAPAPAEAEAPAADAPAAEAPAPAEAEAPAPAEAEASGEPEAAE
jgi:large subunit ribosomal protein L10